MAAQSEDRSNDAGVDAGGILRSCWGTFEYRFDDIRPTSETWIESRSLASDYRHIQGLLQLLNKRRGIATSNDSIKSIWKGEVDKLRSRALNWLVELGDIEEKMYAAEPMFQEDGLGCGTIFEVLVAGSPSASDGSDAEASEREEVDGCT